MGNLGCFVAVLGLVFAPLNSTQAASMSFPIVDVHAHFFPGRGLSFDEAVASAIRQMDQFGVARTIVMSPPRSQEIERNYDYPDFEAALEKYPGRFEFLAGGGFLNPLLHRHADPATLTEAVQNEFAAIARKAIDAGARGFGEMSSLHISLAPQHGYNFVPADHPLLLLLADIAAEQDVPLDLHMDALATDTKPPPALAKFPNNPAVFPATLPALERLLAHNPEARIIWAHGGTDHLGNLSPDRIGALMDRFPNLFVSLKVVGPNAPTQNKLFVGRRVDPVWLSLLQRHSDRFVIGTDNFYVGPPEEAGPLSEFSRTNAPKLEATASLLSLLPEDLAPKIAWQNAVRLFKLAILEQASATSDSNAATEVIPASKGGLCRDGNMEHCRRICDQGIQAACNRLRRSQ